MSDHESETIPRLKSTSRLMWVGAGLALTVVHFVFASDVALEIFRQRGGFTDIGGGWTAIGDVEWSWTPVTWLPSGALFYFADKFDLFALAPVGVLLLFCGSAGAAISAVLAGRALISSSERLFGKCAWKLWLPVLFWLVWVPVPIVMTWTCWHTVKY